MPSLKSLAQQVEPSTDPATPFGRDENDKSIAPMRSDQELADKVREQWQRDIAAKPQCIHRNDADNCGICGTKRIAPPTQVALNWNVVPASEKSKPMSPEEQSAVWESNALRYFGLNPQAPVIPQEPKPKPIKSYRVPLLMDRSDVLALFDPERIIERRVIPADEKVLINKASVEAQATELKRQIDEVNALLETRSVRWQKYNRPEDPLSSADLKRLKYHEQKELKKLRSELYALQERLRNWEADPRNYEPSKMTKIALICFADKYSQALTYQRVDRDMIFVKDKLRKPDDLVSYHTEVTMDVLTPVGGIYDIEGYRKVMQLGSEALAYSAGDFNWEGWEQWENLVILKAIEEGLVKPPIELIESYPGLGVWVSPPDADEEDHEAEENLIRKTGGGALGGATIYSRGWRVGKHSNRLRKLEDFGATMDKGAGKGLLGTGENDASYTSEDQEALEPD